MAVDGPKPASVLVSIAIPTFNRAPSLERALRSAMGQTHGHLEIVVSDNASTDDTAVVCAALARDDHRLRVTRNPRNMGPIENFNTVVAACRGAFILPLADDDWLAVDYVERCLAELRRNPELALVCGRALYYRGESVVREPAAISLLDSSPARRVVAYFRAVGDNAAFYGLMPAPVARVAYPMADILGGDWLLMARVAALGGIETLASTTLSRSLGGMSDTLEGIAASVGIPSWLARHAHLLIGWNVMREVGWRSPVFIPLGRGPRWVLAFRCQPPLVRHWATELYRRLLEHRVMRRLRPLSRAVDLYARLAAARRRARR